MILYKKPSTKNQQTLAVRTANDMKIEHGEVYKIKWAILSSAADILTGLNSNAV
jgi:hypothetical protein